MNNDQESRLRGFEKNDQDKVNVPKFSSNYPLWIIMVLGLVLRWLHLAIVAPTDIVRIPIIDASFYHELAISISNGNVLGDRVFFMSPLYPYLMGLIYSVLGSAPWKMMLLQGLMSAVTIALIYRFAVRLIGNKSALITALGTAVYGPFIFYDATLLTSSLIVLLSAIILNFAYDTFTRGNSSDLIKLGIAIGVSALARPLVLIFLPFVFLSFYTTRRSESLKLASIVIGSALIIMFPIALRNLIVGGEFTLTTSSAGMNFYVGNNKDATGLYWEAPFITSVEPWNEDEEYRQVASSALNRELTTREAGSYWMREGFHWIINNPLEYLKLLGRKTLFFFSRAEFANNISYYVAKQESPIIKFNPFNFWLIAPLGLGGIILLWRRNGWRRVQVLVLWIAAYYLGALLFFNSSEYRLPIVLCLLTGTGFIVTELWEYVRNKKTDSILQAIVLILLFMPLVNLRTGFIRKGENARMDYFNFANTLAKHGKYEEAISRYEKSLAIDPYFEEGLIRLAEAYCRIGKTDEAIEIGKTVGMDNPADILKIVQGLAMQEAYALLNEGRFAEAMLEFAFAGMDTSYAAAETTRYSLQYQAQNLWQEGKRDETLEVYRKLRDNLTEPDPSISYNIAFLLWQNGEVDSAEFFADEALRIDSLNVYAAYLLARIYNATDRREQAEALIRRVNPDESTHQAILEEVRVSMDSLTAIKQWEKALDAYSRYGRLGYEIASEDKYRIGRVQLEIGNIEAALRLLTEAEAAGIKHARLFYHQGRALMISGKRDEAFSAYQRAAAIDPNLVEARIALARIYLNRNQAQHAYKELDEVSHLDFLDADLKKEYDDLWEKIKSQM